MNLSKQTTVGAIATEHPLATRVFARHGIDYCCGGGVALGSVCAEMRLDSDVLLTEIKTEIEESPQAEVRWDEAPIADLINHILEHYHVPLKEEMPRLEEMCRKVHRVHGSKDQERFDGLLKIFLAIKEDIDNHLPKEEEMFFPMILAGRREMLGGPISVMEAEHEDLGAMLVEMRTLAMDYVVPADACNTWRALWVGLDTFERDLHEHIHLENNILHKRAFNG
ncbi:MAG: regulator of cell morphogenesis and NO signaling [Planctomycetota bacterium]|jgi:regulator of cell morphogenesis and NO signaling